MKNLIVANWKMNGNRTQWRQWAQSCVTKAGELSLNTDVVLCAPYPALADVSVTIKGSNRVHLGAQNVNAHNRGAYTGEVSVDMLHEFQTEYCIVGHSERREMGESDTDVGEKFEKIVYGGLRPILCVGEKWPEHEAGDTVKILDQQLLAGLNNVQLQKPTDIAVAYEPVWAISSSGSGRTARAKDVEEAFRYLRAALVQSYGDMGNDIPLLYGGSVGPENVQAFAEIPEVTGVLVGSVSLDSERFLETARIFGQTKGR